MIVERGPMANKKDMNKRRNKAAQKKQAQRKAKVSALRRQANVQVVHRPGISEMGAPDGFRAIGMAQAMLEYAKLLDEYYGKKPQSIDDLNARMKLSMLLWNHALDEEKGEARAASKSEVVMALSEAFGLNKDEAEALRIRMVARRSWLFPEEMQPKERISPLMIMRKENLVEIKPFAYDRLQHTNDKVPANTADLALIENIRMLDRFMEEEADYDEFENLLTETKDEAEKRYKQWLVDRGFPQEFLDLSECIDVYFDFVYGYMHDHIVTMKTVTLSYLTEFFEDFLIRKVYGDPQEYVEWPPAIKLFYLFLKDKGYMDNIDSMTSMINALELSLMNLLKKQFG
jgi:hypothetical protein